MLGAGCSGLVEVAAGVHVVGSDRHGEDEAPRRRVELGAFRVAPRPVSNAEYAAFVQATGHEPLPFRDDPRHAEPDQPACGVSWHDAVAYLAWLSTEAGEPLRLPTEDEREAAARGGLADVDWPWGPEPPDERPELAAIAGLDRPHVPGLACSNALGLSCMADNVHEWCADWRTPRRRASRGGSWRHRVKFTRVSARSSLDPSFRYEDYGFRVFADA